MNIEGPATQRTAEEIDILRELLPLDGARVLELGCGGAEKTRQICEQTNVLEIVAAEVDPQAHAKNLSVDDLDRVTFTSYGAQAIDEANASFDIVLMFKSLHHVPLSDMDAALREIARVLRPGGFAYISEPVFAGDFNEIIRLFHDESVVRRAAFEAVVRAVDANVLELTSETFFHNTVRLTGFHQFEHGILNVTHTDHQLTPQLLTEVRDRFERSKSEAGYVYQIPNRVDLLRKAA